MGQALGEPWGALGPSIGGNRIALGGPWAQALGEIGSPLEALGTGIRGNRIALGGPGARINNDTEWLLRGFCVHDSWIHDSWIHESWH